MPARARASCRAICQPQALLATPVRGRFYRAHAGNGRPAQLPEGRGHHSAFCGRGRFDVLNTHSRRDTVIAAAAGRLAGTPLIVRTRHLSNKVGSLWSYTRLPHCVTTVSDHVRQHLIDRGVPPDRVATVYSPIVLPPPVEHSTLRGELGLAQDDVVVGCVAVMRAPGPQGPDRRDRSADGQPSQAAPGVRRGGSPVFEQTQEYVAQLGLQDRIHLMGMRRDAPTCWPVSTCSRWPPSRKRPAPSTSRRRPAARPWSARTWAACPRCSATARPASWCRQGSGGAGRRADAIDRRSGAAPRHGRGRPQAGPTRACSRRPGWPRPPGVHGKWLAARGK